MLHLKKVLGAKPKEHVEAKLEVLYTPWGESLDSENVLPEHPEPQFARANWVSLNGPWEYSFQKDAYTLGDNLESAVREARPPADWMGSIVVPFSPEAPLSGVGRKLEVGELLWYRRAIDPSILRENAGAVRLLLHFQAVDAVCAVQCNGRLVGAHSGGYTPFAFDITDFLSGTDADEITVCVADPSEFGGQLRGKQRFDRGDIWYSAQSGIWQSTWLEAVPSDRIESIEVHPDAQTGILAIGARLVTQASHELRIEVLDAEGASAASASCTTGEATEALALHVPDAHLWSPDDPYLYKLQISYGDDVVESYCAFRTVEMKRDAAGHLRVHLNGKPLFLKGVLDQAYWPDGLMTAPSDEALVFDIETAREVGFNMMRKHIKIESARWYYHCDRLGMLVCQDMVNGGSAEINYWQWSYKPTLFKASWSRYNDRTAGHQHQLGAGDASYRGEWTRTCREAVRLLGNHPSIIIWGLFNEAWGQFDARGACAMVRELDPTRPIDAVSGWYDQCCGDFNSVHNYFRDMRVWRDARCWNDGGQRAFMVSEFGGFSHRVAGHSSLEESYGYEVYDDVRDWRRAVRAQLAEMDALEARGLAGYVYTQLTDIEEETNGILTYDRRVNKLA